MRHLAQLILVLFLVPCVHAQQAAVTFEGEAFAKTYVARSPSGDRLIEFVRESESFEQWTRLIAYRYQKLPGIGNDPQKLAVQMAKTIKAANPLAQSRVITNEASQEALIDFVTWPPDGKFMEFNVFRYVRSPDGKAIVSLQLAYRFTDATAEGKEKLRRIRESWIAQAVAFDMKGVHAALAR